MMHKTLSGRQGTIHYWAAGDGDEAIVFTHGATMDHGLFMHQMEHFSPRFRAITWDAPAHGLSRPWGGFSLRDAADGIIAMLDAERIASAHLVGQSMGGYICQIAAAGHPDRVRSITAVGSSPIRLSYYSGLDRWLLSITPALLRLYPYGYLVRTIAGQIAVEPASRAYALETLKRYTRGEIAHIMGAVYTGLLGYDRAPLACPILVTYGQEDRTGKVRQYCDRWAAQEGRRLVTIPYAAHNANMDNPAEFNRVLDGFLEAGSRLQEAEGASGPLPAARR